ncbi:MAG: phosphate ABC transporter permease PstA [Solirubrobacteraceae bacterium]|nr:phosphate ABC transporter permease PstA [Solirubrobacteraceae bacterium]
MTTASQPVPATKPSLRSDGEPLGPRVFRGILQASIALSILVLATLLIDVVLDGGSKLSMDFLSSPASSSPANAGIEPAILGTLWLIGVATVFIVPLGVASAIYLEEYADPDKWYNRLIEVNIQNLAAVPSIVYGILGLAFLVRGPIELGATILAGGLTLGLLVLPVVIIAAREAIRSVPQAIRQGALALGATKWQTIARQVLPASIPGIATGVILALSRAIGETAPLIVVGAAVFVTSNPSGLDDKFTALPIQIFEWISRPQEEFQLLAAAGIIVLLVILIAMNSVAIFLRNRYQQKW